MSKELRPFFHQGIAYYTVGERLDVKLYANDLSHPNLMITFEAGYPDIKSTDGLFIT
jgi:hypothetical protein